MYGRKSRVHGCNGLTINAPKKRYISAPSYITQQTRLFNNSTRTASHLLCVCVLCRAESISHDGMLMYIWWKTKNTLIINTKEWYANSPLSIFSNGNNNTTTNPDMENYSNAYFDRITKGNIARSNICRHTIGLRANIQNVRHWNLTPEQPNGF